MACMYAETAWSYWTVDSASGESSCDTSGTWDAWTRGDTTESSSCGVRTWVYWCNTTDSRTGPIRVRRYSLIEAAPAPSPWPLSAEEQQKRAEAAERRAAELQRKLEAEKQAREAAEKRAAELLEQHLDPKQREQFRARKPIRVVGGDGAAFELGYSWAGNVRELDKDGKPVSRFCIHPRISVPIPDLLLAQKLMLESDPAAFRRIANRSEIDLAAEVP